MPIPLKVHINEMILKTRGIAAIIADELDESLWALIIPKYKIIVDHASIIIPTSIGAKKYEFEYNSFSAIGSAIFIV